MSNTDIIIQLLQLLKTYESSHPLVSVYDFAQWLVQEKNYESMHKHLKIGPNNEYVNQNIHKPDNAIGILIALLNKFARNYTKAALADLPIKSIDEFGYLSHLSTHKHITKTDLISLSFDNKTTGTDIIRRLVQNQLANEIINPADKRSKLLEITPIGKKVIEKAYQKMALVSKMVVGNLNPNEKQLLQNILEKLAQFHNNNMVSLQQQMLKNKA
jgi:DNA-binding MarR family transcriptional regulator